MLLAVVAGGGVELVPEGARVADLELVRPIEAAHACPELLAADRVGKLIPDHAHLLLEQAGLSVPTDGSESEQFSEVMVATGGRLLGSIRIADVLRADLLNGAKLLGWSGQIGELKPGLYADIIAIQGNPLEDITTLRKVNFVMKNGAIIKQKE